MGEQVASRILDLGPGKCCRLYVVIKPLVVGGKCCRLYVVIKPLVVGGKCCRLYVVIKPLVVGGKWDLKANVELLRKEEHGVNIQSGLCLKEVNTVEIC
jgi:hypothetical protein